ncbi:Ig-like domain-containing protein [Mangrovibacter sp. SLW1]
MAHWKSLTDNAVADNTATNAVKATVTDSNGNPVPGQTVDFSSTVTGVNFTVSGVTDASGVATATLTSPVAGTVPVTAEVNGSSQTVNTTFVADDSTAEIVSGALEITTDNAVADNTSTNAVKATVTDSNSNPVPGQTVDFSSTVTGVNFTVSGVTDASGVVTATLTSSVAGTVPVTAEVNGSSQTVNTTFVPDDTTATIADADFTVTSGAVANNTDTNTLTAIVKDSNGNVVANAEVTFDVTTGAATPTSQTATTDASGVATATWSAWSPVTTR